VRGRKIMVAGALLRAAMAVAMQTAGRLDTESEYAATNGLFVRRHILQWSKMIGLTILFYMCNIFATSLRYR